MAIWQLMNLVQYDFQISIEINKKIEFSSIQMKFYSKTGE